MDLAVVVTQWPQGFDSRRVGDPGLTRSGRIEVGPSGTEVNDVPINELQIHLISGKKRGLLSQRRDEELRWIAAELRKALHGTQA